VARSSSLRATTQKSAGDCVISDGLLDIAIIQSTHDKAGVKDFVAEYGQVIVDECHHLFAFTFEQVMKQVNC
jgi:superfamily II DNA or RNA helicase